MANRPVSGSGRIGLRLDLLRQELHSILHRSQKRAFRRVYGSGDIHITTIEMQHLQTVGYCDMASSIYFPFPACGMGSTQKEGVEAHIFLAISDAVFAIKNVPRIHWDVGAMVVGDEELPSLNSSVNDLMDVLLNSQLSYKEKVICRFCLMFGEILRAIPFLFHFSKSLQDTVSCYF